VQHCAGRFDTITDTHIHTTIISTMKVQPILLALSFVSVFGFTPSLPGPRRGLPLFITSVDEATVDAEERMEKSVESVLQNMGTVRTGRASPQMLDRVKCDYYGAETPINQLATISVPSAQQLTVTPFDKGSLRDIERAIIDADLGLTPQNDGNAIRLNIPELTEDRRKEMLKQCKAIGEEGKVAVRNIRRSSVESIKKLEKNGAVSEDESKGAQEDIQKLTDKKVKEIDELVGKKEKEVMKI
jgi:ribosome recycling factor